jgi:hypothetical protein
MNFYGRIFLTNTGESKIDIHHNTNATNLLNYLTKKGKLPKFKNTPFEIASLGLNLSLGYVFGKMGISTQTYLDYYLPQTTDNRFSSVFTLNISYSF